MYKLRRFETEAEYSAATLNYPSVSWVVSGDTVHYDKTAPRPTFQGKWLATYFGGTTSSAECDSTSAITENEITKTNLESVEIGDCVTSIGFDAFRDCTSLTSIDIPNSVTSIGDRAFTQCTSLTSCTIGNGVTSIGNAAFFSATSLTNIDIPDSVTNIGVQTFYGCSGLTSITIGNGILGFADFVFLNCTGLESITINATTPPTLGTMAFDNTNDCPILVPSQSVNAYKTATNWSNYASRIQAIQ